MTPISEDRIYDLITRFERVCVINELHGERLDKIEPALNTISSKLDVINSKLDGGSSPISGATWSKWLKIAGIIGTLIGAAVAGVASGPTVTKLLQ